MKSKNLMLLIIAGIVYLLYTGKLRASEKTIQPETGDPIKNSEKPLWETYRDPVSGVYKKQPVRVS